MQNSAAKTINPNSQKVAEHKARQALLNDAHKNGQVLLNANGTNSDIQCSLVAGVTSCKIKLDTERQVAHALTLGDEHGKLLVNDLLGTATRAVEAFNAKTALSLIGAPPAKNPFSKVNK